MSCFAHGIRAHGEDMVAMALEKVIKLPLDEALRRILHRRIKVVL